MRRRLALLPLLLLSLHLAVIVTAQDDDARPLTYGVAASGRLDNRTARQVYTFEGLRGEFITIRLSVTSGDLDPVLLLVGADDTVLMARDDSVGGRGEVVGQLQLPGNGRYRLIVGRFGGPIGSTSGQYELRIDRSGVSSESGSALRYGDTVVNVITNDQPEVYYSFRAERGDIVTLTMRRGSGNLDPYLRIVNAARQIIAENDDMPGSYDSRIDNFVIQEDGQYLIIATRYGFAGGTSTGSFFLTLARAAGSGVGGSPQVAIRLRSGQPHEGEITAERYQVFYSFDAQRDDVVTIRMNRLTGSLDPFLELTNAGLQPLASNDDIQDGVNRDSLISQFRIPADGLYYVIATRYERQAGRTVGRYRLEFTQRGNLFDGVTGAVRMNYGTTATGVLNAATPELLFTFYGTQGEIITASANRSDGDLLPDITLLDRDQRPLVSGERETTRAAIATYTLPRTGVYFLRVSRAEGSGGFIIVLAQRFE